MMPIKDNEDESCFLVTKLNPWRGRYKRIFSVGTTGVTTYNPSTLEITNKWPYSEFIAAVPGPSSSPTQTNSTGMGGEFTITARSKKSSMRFSCEYRADLLTDLLTRRHQFCGAEKQKDPSAIYSASKVHWLNITLPVTLQVAPAALEQRDPTTNVLVAAYNYKDILSMRKVVGCPGSQGNIEAWAIEMKHTGRMHLFLSSDWTEIKLKMHKASNHFLAITLNLDSNRSESIPYEDWNNFRLGKYSGDESLTPIAEFTVQKFSPRHSEPVRRVLCLSANCLIDRDPQTYQVCSVVPLESIFCLVRPRDSAQCFTVQLNSGHRKQYSCHERDSVLASLLDAIRAVGNGGAHVSSAFTSRGFRLLPLWATVDEEIENLVLKLVQTPLADRSYVELLERFNANVPYSGLLHITVPAGIFSENKDKRVTGSLETLMQKEGDLATLPLTELEAQFNALRRLLACKVGFCSFTSLPGLRESIGMRVVKALRRNDEAVAQLALELVCALMVPLHQTWDLRQEQLNKASLLSSPKFLASLLDMWTGHVIKGTGALVVAAMLDVLTFALCAPYSETTNGGHFDQLLEALADRGRCLYKLFQHPCLAIVRGAGLCMKALIEEGSPEVGSKIQHLALSECALLRHLQSALYLQGPEPRTLALRQLSRQLVALWCVNNPDAENLLIRILPSGLLFLLDSDEKVQETTEDYINIRDNLKLALEDHELIKPSGVQRLGMTVQKNIQKNLKVVEKHVEYALQHWGARMGLDRLASTLNNSGDSNENSNQPRPVVLRKRRELVKSKSNWLLFYSKFWLDHSQPDLIWNHRTREELRESIQQELTSFSTEADLVSSNHADGSSVTMSWNHREFEVSYASLSDEIKIGDYYLRLLLERDHAATLKASLDQGTVVGSGIKKASEFFTELYHRFLLSSARADMRAMCLQAMSIVYGQYYEELGPFPDTKFLVAMLDKSIERPERDRLVLFLRQLARHTLNARPLLEANVVRSLVDLVTLAHWHTSRAMVPSQSNVLEAGPGMTRDQEKEWFYEVSNERKGPVSYKDLKELFVTNAITARTKCWSQGMESWRQLHQVPQLKWGLLARGEPVLDESQLAHLALGILTQLCFYAPSREEDGSIIRPLPRVKLQISDPSCLPHIVQLLLTFDPRLVESVSTLLTLVMADNPSISCLYMTGVFYFVLMYSGSNVLPIARFLASTHTLQACSRAQQAGGSVLSPLLPEAMVHFLVNHGSERFAEVFLGEFDTPEAIWSSEMRRHLCERLSAHLSDFTPRLASNTRAIYSHCAIPVVNYPQLESELFCGSFYLRHLCDETKFPNWPIPQPVELLREVLLAWKREVEKKPPAMSVEEAYTELGLSSNKQPDEAAVRKAYYVLAQKFHPDKNPEGREKFEAVNKAYEFLCSRVSRDTSGPNPENIVLILRAQSILFRRYKEELSSYKYSGYPQLVKTIRLETWDETLFSKQAPLLSCASELAYHTVDCCALNAEELRREGGIDALLEALSRCVSVLGLSSKPRDCAVKVCCNVVQTLAVCAKSQACRDKMVELPRLVWEVCAVLQWQHLGELACYATACVASLAADSILQMALVQCGALWPVLSAMFGYDYTLEEGGVATTEGASSQETANKLARLSLDACAALCGFLPISSNPLSKDCEKGVKNNYPSNPVAQNAVEKLLTPYIAHKLGYDSSDMILKTLTSNSENPYLIWDNGTRAQLLEFIENQRKIRRDPGDLIDPSTDLVPNFTFSVHEDELIVGGVFLRVYNDQPSFPIQNPKGFVIELLDFLKYHSSSLQQSPDDKAMKQAHMALTSLSNVLKNNKGVELQLIGHFRLIASLICVPKLQPECLIILNTACTNQECVTDIAASEIIHSLLIVLLGNSDILCSCLDCLHGLSSSPKAVKEALSKGAVLYLLNTFCSSEAHAEVRSRAAELLSRLASDRLSGPRVKLSLSRFLPISLADLILASPRMAVGVYDGTHENPELVWGPSQRQQLEAELNKMLNEFSSKQKLDSKSEWKPPDNFVLDGADSNELVVGGVYLRLYASNPGWTLKRPKLFLGELLDTTINLMAKEFGDSPKLELAVSSLVGILTTQPALAEALPSLGHLPKVIKTLATSIDKNHSQAAVGATKVLLQLSKSPACVEALRTTECVATMKMTMQKFPQAQATVCETFCNWFSSLGADHIVYQVVQTDLVPYLLSLLRSESSTLSAANKAHVVQALKALRNSNNQQVSDKVAAQLDGCPGWAEYRDQKHDLFLTGGQEHAYLTGAPAGMAGYLTDGRSSAKLPDQPPPLHPSSDTPDHRRSSEASPRFEVLMPTDSSSENGRPSDTEELLSSVSASQSLPPSAPPLSNVSSPGTVPRETCCSCGNQSENIIRRELKFEEFECDVAVQGEEPQGDVAGSGASGTEKCRQCGPQRQEFSFTLYDLDGHGKITKDDIAGLVTTIYETLGATIQVPHSGSKTIRVRLTVAPESRGTNDSTQPSPQKSGSCHPHKQTAANSGDNVASPHVHKVSCNKESLYHNLLPSNAEQLYSQLNFSSSNKSRSTSINHNKLQQNHQNNISGDNNESVHYCSKSPMMGHKVETVRVCNSESCTSPCKTTTNTTRLMNNEESLKLCDNEMPQLSPKPTVRFYNNETAPHNLSSVNTYVDSPLTAKKLITDTARREKAHSKFSNIGSFSAPNSPLRPGNSSKATVGVTNPRACGGKLAAHTISPARSRRRAPLSQATPPDTLSSGMVRERAYSGTLQRQELLHIIQTNMEKNLLALQHNSTTHHRKRGEDAQGSHAHHRHHSTGSQRTNPLVNRRTGKSNSAKLVQRKTTRTTVDPANNVISCSHYYLDLAGLESTSLCPHCDKGKNSKGHARSKSHDTTTHHLLRHKTRELDHARAMAQVVEWLQGAQLGGSPSLGGTPNTLQEEEEEDDEEDEEDDQEEGEVSGGQTHTHRHIHEHVHHHYHHYTENQLVV